MTITPADIEAATQVAHDVGEQAEDLDFEVAVRLRRELQRLVSAAQLAISYVETDMLRQVEQHARTVNGVTYARDPQKSRTADHERVLDRAWKRALSEAVNEQDGTVDWEMAGEAMRDLVVSLYLAPSTIPKAGGLSYLEIDPEDVISERIKGYKLTVLGEEQ